MSAPAPEQASPIRRPTTRSQASDASEPPNRELSPYRHPAFRWVLAGGVFLLALFPLWWPPTAGALLGLEEALTGLFPLDLVNRLEWIALPLVGLVGGFLASVSPCVLPLIPLNAAYIRATGAGPTRAVGLSARFALGAVLSLSILGLAADAAGLVFVEYRGPVRLAVGAILLALGALKAGLLSVPPVPVPAVGRKLGPTAAGATFALITSPCVSPLLFAVLAAAGAQAIPGLAVVTMACFALGYTSLVFVAGMIGGRIRVRPGRPSSALEAGAAALLILAGIGFSVSGLLWFW
jgi:cytochrome c-type biogenesis protein